MRCANCGANLASTKCEYCGSDNTIEVAKYLNQPQLVEGLNEADDAFWKGFDEYDQEMNYQYDMNLKYHPSI